MHDTGTALLYIAFIVVFATGLTALAGARLRSPGLLAASRHGLVATWLLFLAMGACLIFGLVTHDFANRYIAAYTDVDMPLAYLLAGFWGGEKGALLFWVTVLSSFSCLAVLRNRTQSQVFLGYVTAFLSFAIFFFALLMVFEANPFEVFATGSGPVDGKGMNPLLQNPLMAIHPPSLLTGYISFTVPYAFGLAALVTGQLDSQWLRDTRKWTLISWLFLSLGLILGGAWAYEELGWGGFWMWDPVENAGLIPWFTATAFLHSVMIQERRNMLKRWNAVLVCLTFLLTIFGTFLTRSQLIDSVHAFADSKLADYFLWYMAVIAVISAVAVAWRWRQMRADAELDSLMSRESFFILNNVLLVGCAFVVLWGTVFGQISEARPVQALYNQVVAIAGSVGVVMVPLQQKVQLGEPWFNRVMTPLGLSLLLMTGIGPLISWRRATRRNFQKNFKRPLVVSSLAALAMASSWLASEAAQHGGLRLVVDDLGMREVYGLLCVWFSVFVTWTIALEFHAGARARQKVHGTGYALSMILLTLRNKRRYGGYIVHLGVVMCFLAFTGNAFRTYQPEIALHPGDRTEIGRYALFFTGQDDRWEADGAYAAVRATVIAMDKHGVVPESAVETVRKLVGPRARLQTEPGSPRVAVTFADVSEGRAFAARQFAGWLAAHIAGIVADTRDPRVLHMALSADMAQVAGVTPQVIMKFFGELRDTANATLAGAEVRTAPGQPAFSMVFADLAARQQFQRLLSAGPWPGVLYAAVNPHAELAAGVRVDVVPVGAGMVLAPEVRFYKKHSSPTTEVAIESFVMHDLYLAMRPAQGQRFINLLAVVFPFVSLLWLGAIVMIFGSIICILPARQALAAPDEDEPRRTPVAVTAASG